MATQAQKLSSLFQFNQIKNPGGSFNLSPTNASPVSTPGLNTNVPSSLSELSIPQPQPVRISTTGPLGNIGASRAMTPQGNLYAISSATGASAPAVPAPAPVNPTGPAAPLFPSNSGPVGATGSTGSTPSLPSQYYNADGTLKDPSQVATEVGSSLAAAHGNGDVAELSGAQFANPDGGTTADAQAAAANINNTKNDISTGATDPYNVAGNSGIAYTPEELDAIQKAYAGVYTPALSTALAKVTLKQNEDKAALENQNALQQIDEQAKATVAAQANAPYTLGSDQIRYDASGNPIAAGPESYQNALLNSAGSSNGGNGLQNYIRTTASGNKYVDTSTVTDPTQKAALENAAKANGLMPVTDANAQKLQAIDDTRTNLDQIATQFAKVGYQNGFTKTLGGFGLSTNAEGLINPDISSLNAWRTAAINSIQALAGGSGSGVRINQAEINSAMENDIPNATDTLAQGQAKIAVLKNQLNNWENQILNTTGSGGTGSSGAAPAPITTPDGKQWTQNADGSYTQVFNSVGNTTASTLPKAPVGTDSSVSLNRPQRNNNPGDLKPGGIADSLAIGVSPEGDLVFPNEQAGFQAMKADVTAKINGDSKYLPANPTIAQLGSIYAQDPNWAAKVAGILNVPASTKTQAIPINDLVQAIATQEGYYA